MGNKVKITLYCASTKKKSKIVYEEKNKNEWHSVDCYANQDPPKPKNSFFSSLAGIMGVKTKVNNEQQQDDETVSAKGKFYYYHQCPHCGKTSYVKCSACGHISCWDSSDKKFECGLCGNVGEVSGTIESLNVEEDKEHKDSSGSKYRLS